MSLLPFLNAPIIVQLHVPCAVPALAGVAMTGLFIPAGDLDVIGSLGLIHLFRPFAIWGIGRGIWMARIRQFERHRTAIRKTWMGTIELAGSINFITGRTVNGMTFDEPSQLE